MSDRSLDEFAVPSSDAVSSSGDDSGDAPADAPDGSTTATDPATPTMRWSADPVACDACGAAVSRRWRDGDTFVCADCKEW